MNKPIRIFAFTILAFSTPAFSQDSSEVWKPEQLIAPVILAAVINNPSAEKPLIINVGPAGRIKGSIETGPVDEKENLKKLKQLLLNEKKDRDIVIYCGCCPYKKCPNIRPAFSLLNSLGFIHHKLLDLPHNLKVDWIDHGYPMKD